MADDVLERLGAPPHRNSIAIPYFTTAPLIVAETDAVMLLPTRVADRFAAMLSLTVIPIPINRESFPYGFIWHKRTHDDAGINWLRDSLFRTSRQDSVAENKTHISWTAPSGPDTRSR